MDATIIINGWLVLFLCIIYSTGSVFTFCIFEETFKEDKYAKYDLLFMIVSYLWFIGLVGYIIWGIYGIIKDFRDAETKKLKL